MWTPIKAAPSGVSMERRPVDFEVVVPFSFFFFVYCGGAHREAGSNREYVVILACIEAITIAMLMILHNLYGPGLQPGRCWCQGMVRGTEGRWWGWGERTP